MCCEFHFNHNHIICIRIILCTPQKTLFTISLCIEIKIMNLNSSIIISQYINFVIFPMLRLFKNGAHSLWVAGSALRHIL